MKSTVPICFPKGSDLDASLKKRNLMKATDIKHRNQNETKPFQTKNVEVEKTRKKSAEASSKPPNLLSECICLASAPSKTSVRHAKAKTGNPHPPSMRDVIKTLVRIIRVDVKNDGTKNISSSFTTGINLAGLLSTIIL
jgi:hypothetical protein